MNRADARLWFAIVATAIVASVVTVVVYRALVDTETSPSKLHALDHRVSDLEARAHEAPVAVIAPLPPIAPIARPDVPAEAPLPPEPVCDEVSCVLDNYTGPCCAQYRRGPVARPKPGDLPESLDRVMISDAIGKVKARIMACGDRSTAKGRVRVRVRVSPDGAIRSVDATDAPDAELGSCVTSAVGHATFAKTQSGGSFSYPFVF